MIQPHPICIRYDYTRAHFFKVEKIVFHEHLKSGFLKRIIVSMANKWPSLYENVFSSILPLHEISFYLRKALRFYSLKCLKKSYLFVFQHIIVQIDEEIVLNL